MEDLVRAENLCKRFEGFALRGVTLRVPRGAVVGLIGENGAGKSTLIKSILGLVRPDAGSVSVFGKPVAALSREDRGAVGVVLGQPCLPENLDLKGMNAVMKRVFARWDEAAFFGWAERFSLPADKKLKTFSRGMGQKAALAAALSHGARLLLLDEPTGGLDPVARDEVLGLLYDFMQGEDRAVLISSHIPSDLEKLCDYIAFLHEGELLFFEEKDALTERYCLVRCAEGEIAALGRAAVAVRRGEFGCDVLAERALLPAGTAAGRAGIEDIMLLLSRGEKTEAKQ